MFVVKYESPIVGATDQIGRIEQLLFPFTNFTCSGSITRLMFVASKPNEIANLSMISSWPTFSLWHRQGDSYNEVSSIGPFHPDQITSVQPPSRSIFNDRQVEVVMVNFSSPVHFEAGNILGLRQHPFNTSSSRYIRVLRQRWGYGLKLICEPSGCPVDIEYPNQEVPYIAVETGN